MGTSPLRGPSAAPGARETVARVPGPRGRARPMLASPGELPRGAGWAFEFVWSGLRCLGHAGGGELRLLDADGHDVTAGFPELGAPAAPGLVLDGVVVALDAVGRPSPSRLRRRSKVRAPSRGLVETTPVSFYVFDVLEVGGRSTARMSYRERRELLAEIDLAGGRVVVPPSFTGVDAEQVVRTARHYGLEGVVAKRVESTYQGGRRSRSWISSVVTRPQDVVVGGWLPPRGGGAGIGSLLLGVPSEGTLRYVGRVSTGVTAGARREMFEAAQGLTCPVSPFDDPLPADVDAAAHWLTPRLVGHVEHRRWTPTGLLGRPVWRGLRAGTHPATVQAPVLAAPVVATDLALDDLATVDGPRLRRPGHSRGMTGSGGASDVGGTTPARTPPTLEVALPDAEVEAALRSRFSAHFVHNALTAIAAYVRLDPSRARELLTEFADFTRYSFRDGEAGTTVAEELRNARRYLTLEQARFGPRLGVEVTIAPDVEKVVLPPFVVAPLVENAVRHGIEPKPEGGTVHVTASGAGADCLVTVSDDGAGMGPEAFRAASQVDARHGGIAEVSRRLQAAFGSSCDLHVDSRPGSGTTVRLRVPARDREQVPTEQLLVG
ncbi:histidine kinase [Actinomycetospora endophytica]|uniref:DNA ligase (ATP) n=1 Tax=Actinomycetospora endophytica TaxID=2291215 RepID=A0ABS8P5A2_9PSEU|nr:histidine kinase [Actinomycetospora endophytica]MCD2193426.1 histidine kinase [Actinomycetospora endophytica]